MEIQISGQHFEVTEAIQKYIREKLSRLKKHFDHLVNVHIVLKVQKTQHIAEATIHVRHQDIYANANSDNMYATIDVLVDKLDRQILKHKEKIRDHHSKEVDHHELNK